MLRGNICPKWVINNAQTTPNQKLFSLNSFNEGYFPRKLDFIFAAGFSRPNRKQNVF